MTNRLEASRITRLGILWTVYHTIIALELAVIIGIQIAILATLINS